MSAKLLAIRDFIFNPILEKDLRSTARSLKFFLFILAFLFIGCICALIFAGRIQDLRAGTGLALFLTIFVVQSICIGLAIPAYSCTTIAGERQQRTFDLLRITSLKPWEVTWGKFIAIMCYIVVFIVAFLPLVAVSFLYGGTDPKLIATLYVFLLLNSAVSSMFCLMLSAASSHPIKTVIVGYIFMGATSSLWSPLTALVMAGFGVQAGFWMGGGVPGFWTILLLTVLGLLFFWSLFYLSTTSLLKPPSWNKSTSLRIWFAAFLLVSLGAFCWLFEAPADYEVFAAYLITAVGIPSVFAAVGFCGEPAELLPRLRAKVKKVPGLLRAFAPGRLTAAVFVRAIFLLTAGIAALFFAEMGVGDGEKAFLLALGMFVYVSFCCSLAGAVRALWDVPRSRIITVSILVGLILLPMLAFLDFDRHHPLAGVIWISPPLALADTLGDVYRGLDTGPVFFFGFYIVAAFAAFWVGVAFSKKRRRVVIRPRANELGEAGVSS